MKTKNDSWQSAARRGTFELRLRLRLGLGLGLRLRLRLRLRLGLRLRLRLRLSLIYAFYVFYAWWVYFPRLGALAEGTSRPMFKCLTSMTKRDTGGSLAGAACDST